MTIHFEPLVKKKQAITYIDDTKMQAQNKNEMFTVINEDHTLLRKAGLKAAPDKTFFSRKSQVSSSYHLFRRTSSHRKKSKGLNKSQITRK